MSTENDVSMPCWSHQEFETLDLGDNRLTQRLICCRFGIVSLPANPLLMLLVRIGQRPKRRIVYLIMSRWQRRKSYLLIFNEPLSA